MPNQPGSSLSGLQCSRVGVADQGPYETSCPCINSQSARKVNALKLPAVFSLCDISTCAIMTTERSIYANLHRPVSLTLIRRRKTHFKEFSVGAGSHFNLRQQGWELSLLRAVAVGSMGERNSIDWVNSSFTYKGFLSRPINSGMVGGGGGVGAVC